MPVQIVVVVSVVTVTVTVMQKENFELTVTNYSHNGFKTIIYLAERQLISN